LAHGGEFVVGQWPPGGMQRSISDIDAADRAKNRIQQ